MTCCKSVSAAAHSHGLRKIRILRECMEVLMKQFSFPDMNRASGAILEAASI